LAGYFDDLIKKKKEKAQGYIQSKLIDWQKRKYLIIANLSVRWRLNRDLITAAFYKTV